MNTYPESFFRAIVPFLRGEASAAEVETQLGPVPGGGARLAFYRTLMIRNVHHIVASLFPATRVLLSHLRPNAFSEIVMAFDCAHPASDFEPNQYARSFPAYLEELGQTDALLLQLAELADYEWLLFAVGTAISLREPVGDRHGPSLVASCEPKWVLRQYEWDVARTHHELTSSNAALTKQSLPVEHEPTSLLFLQDSLTGRTRVHRLNPADIVALGIALGKVAADTLPPDALASSQKRLLAWGAI